MEISGPNPASLAATVQVTAAQSVVDAWKVGQLVNARVVTQTQNGQAAINVGGTVLLAQTQFPLQTGQSLQLEVSNLASLAVLKLVSQLKNTPPVTLQIPSQSHAITQWRTGKILEALVLNTAERGKVSLNISGQSVEARLPQALPLNLSPNQHLKLEIIDPGKIAALRILNALPAVDNLSQTLRSTLPQQAPLPPLINTLVKLAQTPALQPQQTQQIPVPVIELARSIVDKLPTPKMLSTPEGLQQALNQSGLFLEAKLSQNMQAAPTTPGQLAANISTDFKAGLLSLLASLFTLTKPAHAAPLAQQSVPVGQLAQYIQQALQQTQGQTASTATQQSSPLQQPLLELMRSVESGLARIILNQFASSGTEEEGRRSWVIDIPVRHEQQIDLFQLRIDKQEAHKQRKTPTIWTVNLAFELQSLGPLQVCITLSGGVINTTFWAEQEKTSTFINQHIESLYQGMRDAGLTVGKISALQGKSPESLGDIPQIPHVLLDVKA